MARSFFTDLLNSATDEQAGISYAERLELNASQDRADQALDVAQSAQRQVARAIEDLQQQITAQAELIHTLSSAVSVLAATLRDAGVVDAEVLEARFEAALINAEEEAAARAAAARAKEAAGKARGITAKATCAKCGIVVPANQTVMTERGTICDRCDAGL
jgi:septal ring factor EnvC (AmiA/AmiB activator)